MSSYISSSDTTPPALWRRWLAVFCGVLFGATGLVYLFLLVLDPFDTGRFPSVGIAGVMDESPRTANASRGRDPRFDSAIVGSSTGQPLDPTRLARATGLSFVQLTTPGTGPREQLALLDYFVARHERIGALVLVVDNTWCTQDASLPMTHPFPFWLYADHIEYLRNLLSERAVRHAFRRIGIALGVKQATDPVGYKDYEAGKAWNFHPDISSLALPASAPLPLPDVRFPAIERLGDFLGRQRSAAPFVIVMPPIFATALPRVGTAEAAHLAACKAALARVASGRPGARLLDFHVDDEVARDPRNFMDTEHYRAEIARKVEAGIAIAISSGAGSRAQSEPAAGPLNR